VADTFLFATKATRVDGSAESSQFVIETSRRSQY